MNNADIRLLITEDEKFNHGATWSEEELRREFGIEEANLDGDREFIIRNLKRYDLQLLGAYASVNNILLDYGRVFIREGDSYRVPLISEIHQHINKYYEASKNKHKRGDKLRRSFERLHPIAEVEDTQAANRRAAMMDSATRHQQPQV